MPETTQTTRSARVLCFQTGKARLEAERAGSAPSVETPPVLPFTRPLDPRQTAHRRAMLAHLERAAT